MKKSFLNLNINKEDNQLNDFLFCWNLFDKRPNKTSVLTSFKSIDFQNFLLKFDIKTINTFTEIFPLENDSIVNRRSIGQYNDDIFISYTEYDIEQEDSLINEIHLFHKEAFSNELDILYQELLQISDKIDDDISNSDINSYILSVGTSGFEITPTPFIEIDSDNFDLYYNDETLKKKSKLEKNIKKFNKGLTVIHGERGVGKSSLVHEIVKNIDKKSIFIPCSLFETTINNPDFRNYLKSNNDCLLILDDSELFFSEIYSKSNIFTNNLLQIVDGLDSDNLKAHILVILNVDDINQVDHILLESNNLLDIIDVKSLEIKKIKDLSNHLGRKTKTKSNMRLIDVLKKKNLIEVKSDIGFV
jgi:hypothetical protein